jgi:hypothetical protein
LIPPRNGNASSVGWQRSTACRSELFCHHMAPRALPPARHKAQQLRPCINQHKRLQWGVCYSIYDCFFFGLADTCRRSMSSIFGRLTWHLSNFGKTRKNGLQEYPRVPTDQVHGGHPRQSGSGLPEDPPTWVQPKDSQYKFPRGGGHKHDFVSP